MAGALDLKIFLKQGFYSFSGWLLEHSFDKLLRRVGGMGIWQMCVEANPVAYG